MFALDILCTYWIEEITSLLCVKCRPKLTESKNVTLKFVLYIKFVKVWYTTTLSKSNYNEGISKVSKRFCENSLKFDISGL